MSKYLEGKFGLGRFYQSRPTRCYFEPFFDGIEKLIEKLGIKLTIPGYMVNFGRVKSNESKLV